MNECCSMACENKPNNSIPICPMCGHRGTTVGLKTLQFHIRQPWLYLLPEQDVYYFCQQPNCTVVYFSPNGVKIEKAGLRTRIGIKDECVDTLRCYCFGITKAEATDKNVKAFVIRQTKAGMCACETANPSGKCCLKDFPA